MDLELFYRSESREVRIKVNAVNSGVAFQVLLFALEILIVIQLS